MDDLSLDKYLSQERRIKELETKLRTATQRASKYKKLYQDLGGKVNKRQSRTDKALQLISMIKTGVITMKYKEVARRCKLSHQHVLDLSSQYNKEQLK